MRAQAGILIVICSLFLINAVTANYADPVSSTFSPSDPGKIWVIANGVDQNTIKVVAYNNTPGFQGAIRGAPVKFMIDNPLLGTISPFDTTTDNNGEAICTFTVNTKSGTAHIGANITSTDASGATYYTTLSWDQKIDHDIAYIPLFSYPLEGTVGTEVPFNITITDRWGNRIDNAKTDEVHTISLHVHGPAPDNCGFNTGAGYGHDISPPLGSNGELSVMVKLTSKNGPNSVLMDPMGSVPEQLKWIEAVTRAEPVFITQAYNPEGLPPTLPTDGESKFIITYTLYDAYGNPTKDQEIRLNTSLNEVWQPPDKSNSLGQIQITYGPKSDAILYNINATSVTNSSVTINKDVRFINTAPTTVVIMANPAIMPSREVNLVITSAISAKVMDAMGNPVENETVMFSLGPVSYPGGPFNSSLPSLMSSSAITDPNGLATVQFIPGAFVVDPNALYYSPSATATCTVIATWNGVSVDTPVSWKNYPYLSVSRGVDRSILKLNETVDVTLTLNGDGFALQQKPVDVVLCTDRSGSMLYDNPDRMFSIREAAKTFIDRLSGIDRIALVTFGRNGDISRPGINSGIAMSEINNAYTYPRTYSAYATSDKSLSTYVDFSSVKDELDKIVPDHGTPLREALRVSIQELGPTSGRVRAIVLLSDGDFNWYGDPLARDSTRGQTWGPTSYNDLDNDWKTFTGVTNQNMAAYANDNNIKIYSIAYGSSISSGGQITLQTLAESTGGKYYSASATNIGDVYRQIAGELRTEAGVDTKVSLDYGTIMVNNESDASGKVFEYVPDPPALPSHAPGSTYVHKFNKTNPDIWHEIINQQSNWTANKNLEFNVGTIKLNETWETTFRLKAIKEGYIDVFGPASTIKFNDSENTGIDTLSIQPLYISVSQNQTSMGFGSSNKTLILKEIKRTGSGPITGTLPIQWKTSYTGVHTVAEQVKYSINGGSWSQFAVKTGIPPGETTQYAQLDVSNLPPGGYLFSVYAYVDSTDRDAGDAEIHLPVPVEVAGQGRAFIKLE